MNEKQRPTKKQQELLVFIKNFINENGYGPSYREIMNGCNYSSVATVAAHINNLISRGHLTKKTKSARSLEITDAQALETKSVQTNQVSPNEEKWLVERIDYKFSQAEDGQPSKNEVDELYVLVGALKVLGLDGAAQSFMPRLSDLKKRAD
ncbi:hypothetical protein HZB74_03235 [Candidatus Saccharibacteria bacterium]|nr:hypothetical protein [Candidatus Saccharibacteria bacterium]